MEYQAAVAEARTLVKRSEEDQWRLAQLTWEQVESGATYAQWARDIEVDREHVARMHRLWSKWGATRSRPRYADAYTEARSGTAGAPTTADQRQQEAVTAVRSMPPERKAEVVREALAEPEVAEQVVRHTPTRTNLAKAEHTVDREQQHTARERYELAEPRSHQIGAIADAEYALTKARQAFEDAAEAADTLTAHDWPDNSKERVTILTQRALAAGELVRAKVEGRNLDEELAALLEGDA
jgi:preprotein translocase subunit SecD